VIRGIALIERPEALLFYNDYNLEFTGPKSNAAYAFVQELLAAGVPMDGVGFRGHLDTQYGYPDLQNNLQRFADLGLEVALTEVDVRTYVRQKPNGTYTNTPADPAEGAEQVDWWARTLEACLAVEACNSYTVWGVLDANSWIPGWFTGQGAGLLYDMHNNPKRRTRHCARSCATPSDQWSRLGGAVPGHTRGTSDRTCPSRHTGPDTIDAWPRFRLLLSPRPGNACRPCWLISFAR
jgi:GH35 family endo-1,4-beta-xylanase